MDNYRTSRLTPIFTSHAKLIVGLKVKAKIQNIALNDVREYEEFLLLLNCRDPLLVFSFTHTSSLGEYSCLSVAELISMLSREGA